MATLKDIAKEAGVSVMTVSNVINNNHAKVSDKNIKKISELVKKYNYVPSLAARSLVGKSSHIIGLIIPDGGDGTFLNNPHNSEVIASIEKSVRKHGYYLMVRSVSTYADISELLQNWNVDGAILLGIFEDVLEEIIKQCTTPMVFLDSYTSSKKITNVGINDFKGGYLATKYLISNGHKKIAFLGTLNDHDGDDVINCRLNGYKAALKEATIDLNLDYLIPANSNYQDGIRVGELISGMGNRPTAVVMCADVAAIGFIEGARLSGLIVPDDISVIGFDNLECCAYSSPKLTSVHQDTSSKGSIAVDLLLNHINDKDFESQNIVLDVRIKERGSVKRNNI